MSKTKVTTFVGTRPEIIRLACIIKAFDKNFEHRLVHTGQNPDPQLKDVFFKDLGLRDPDSSFPDSHNSLGEFMASLFINTEKELLANRPDAVLILGDTNSAMAAIIAKRMGIPVYHLEAGNRSFDVNVPEEINRRIVDHIADFNFPYSELARTNLLAEGIHPRKISLLGSPMFEVFASYKKEILASKALEELKLNSKAYFLVSAHRQENVDSNARLTLLLESLNAIAEKYEQPVLVSTHPRTKMRLDKLQAKINPLINFHRPFGFFDYNKLQLEARVVLSDSGSISEESVILGFKAVTIRDSMERPEALESGSIIMCGIEKSNVLEALEIAEAGSQSLVPPPEYGYPDVAARMVNVLVSTVHRTAFWTGLRPLDS